MPKVIRRAYHPAHGGPIGAPQPHAAPDQPSFASAPTKRGSRSDPAPSRWSYRLQRLMLTPMFRTSLKIGAPILVIAAIIGGFLADEARRAHVAQTFTDLRASIEQRPEFMVRLMKVEGASAPVSADIHEILPVEFPISSFDLDLDQMRETIAGLDPVERVSLRLQPGGTLRVRVTERVPAVVWRSDRGLEVLDSHGIRVGSLQSRAQRADLPVVAGDGADKAVEEALALIQAAGPISGKMRGLVRMGERRWDVVLEDDKRILLPVEEPVRALERVIAMDVAMDLIERDIASVDLRLDHRPTLRLRDSAVEELRRIKAMEQESEAQQ